jgi:hypothetical protein
LIPIVPEEVKPKLSFASFLSMGVIQDYHPILKVSLQEVEQWLRNRIGIPFATREEFHQ